MKSRTSRVLLSMALLALAGSSIAAASPPTATQDVIVVLEDGADARAVASSVASAHAADIGHVYEHALTGFSASLPSAAVAALSARADVAYVEVDRAVSIAAQTTPTGVERIFANTTELDIDQTDDQRVDVDVAVIDTGIDFEHPDLDVVGGVNCASGGPFGGNCSAGGDDDHYHGTHVAGTIAALDNGEGVVGVAPGARLHAVKVLNSQGSGYTSWIVAGIDWVAANASTIEVANMSLGGAGFSQAEYDAIQGAVNAGVAFAVAAGNESDDANNYSPGGFDNVLSVSALADFDGLPGGNGSPTCRTDQDDTLADFSNWGTAVDVAAPGVCILSTFPLEQGSYASISGTSMAAPHVAGALALLASNGFSRDANGVQGLYDAVTSSGNFDWTDDSGDGILEPLLDISTGFAPTLVATGGGGGGGGESISLSASGYKVKGVQHADLSWSGATGTDIDVYRDGALVVTTANDGAHTDNIGSKGGGSYDYQVCEAGTTTCSAVVTVVF